MASDLLKSAYRRTWWSLVLRGILSIAVGVIILWRPAESTAALALLIAIWALVSGIVQIVHAVDLRDVFSQWWVMLVGGIVGVGFGIAALYYYPTLSLAFAVVWTTWWLVFTGGLAIYLAIQERRLGLSWGWTMAFGVVSVAAGVIAAMYPLVTLAAVMSFIAAYAFVGGVVLLVGAFKLASAKDELTVALGAPRPV
jgi:uncharacterized membrane protein HdeD (DUF308 family)